MSTSTPDTEAAPARRRWRPGRRTLEIVALCVALLLLLIALWDWNWFKGPAERALSSATGRAFHIDGDLDVDLGRTITVSADGLRLANPAWSQQAEMATVERLEVDVAALPLLAFRLHVRDLRARRADIRLETGTDGEPGNWTFEGFGTTQEPDDGPPRWRLDRLWLENGRLRFVDAPEKTDIDIALQSVAPGKAEGSPVAVDGSGRWRGAAFKLDGHVASPLDLVDTQTPYRIDLKASAGATRARASGTLTHPFQFRQFDLQMALSGQDLEDLYPLLGLALPPSPPYALDGRLGRTGDRWRYTGFNGRVGDSDLAGDVHVDVSGDRPHFKAELTSRRLDFDDLAGFVGAPPRTGDGETANARQQAQAAERAASPRLLPDTPYDLDKLRAMDADVRWRAQRINAPGWPLDDMDAHLLLEDGLLRLDPLNFGVAGGDIRATIRMNARDQPITTSAQIALRGLDLPKLFPTGELARDAVGRIGGDIRIEGRGNSIAAIFGSADGDVAVGMGPGRISNLIMELAGLDVAESLRFLITKDRQVPIRCAFADFSVQDGLMQTRALAFDSTDTIIVGEGTVSLKDEELDLLLRPRPKDRSILSLRSPLRVAGTFKDPAFRPDFAALGLRGAVALALGSITPPAALLATFETGPGKDSDCGGAYAR